MSMASKRLRISRPSRGTGQVRMTRKEYEKNHPSRMPGSDRVLTIKDRVPSTPMTEVGEGTIGPECAVKAE